MELKKLKEKYLWKDIQYFLTHLQCSYSILILTFSDGENSKLQNYFHFY